jgi:general secretion pathway protein N
MMKSLLDVVGAHKKRWIGIGLLCFVYFLLTSIPAHWGGYLLTRGSGLALSGVTGSLWDGRASLASVKVNGSDYSLGPLTWKINVFSLLSFKPCAYMTTRMDNQSFEGNVCSNGSSLQLKDASLELPAAWAQSQLPFPVAGQLSIHLEEFSLRGNVLLGLKGKLSWNGAQVNNGASWVDLGSLAADFTDNGSNGIKAKVFELGGPVRVDLAVELMAPSGGRITGTLAAPEGFIAASNVSNVLALFSQQDGTDDKGNSRYLVDFNL